ncbi:hypothetical protein DFH06DRAFT_1147992 [Mycena polygramma]|nr:hypothetical protein DFH06DRAFT_1147992 [Mycena polygramma]
MTHSTNLYDSTSSDKPFKFNSESLQRGWSLNSPFLRDMRTDMGNIHRFNLVSTSFIKTHDFQGNVKNKDGMRTIGALISTCCPKPRLYLCGTLLVNLTWPAISTVKSTTQDWLAQMILAVKTVAAGVEFVQLQLMWPQKVKKNRDDLRDLCAGIVEIVLLIHDEISAHDSLADKRLMGLCENFIALLGFLESGLKRLVSGRSGVRGLLKELFGAASVGYQIERYKTRIHELGANLLVGTAVIFPLAAHEDVLQLAATINTNMHVTGIEKVLAIGEARSMVNQFRQVALGDINLIHEVTAGTVQKIKIFTAQISGEPSTMTVAQYPDDDNVGQKIESPTRYASLIPATIAMEARFGTVFTASVPLFGPFPLSQT